MKKIFLSFLLFLLMIPAFSLGFEFDFFSGTGFTAGFTTASEVFNRSWGIWFDSRDVEYEYEYKSDNGSYYSTTKKATYSDTRKTVGPYMQFDWSILPFDIAGIAKCGFNVGFKVAAGYVSSEKDIVDAPFDMIWAPMISAMGRWRDLDITLGWKGAFHLADYAVGNKRDDDDELQKGGWVNSFQIGVKYVLGGRHSSSDSSSESSADSSSAKSGSQDTYNRETSIISGSGMRRAK